MPQRDPSPQNEPEQLPLGGIPKELRLPENETESISTPHAEADAAESQVRPPRAESRPSPRTEQQEIRYLLADGSNANALVADVLNKEGTPDAAGEEYITRLSWEIRQYALAVMGQEKHAAEEAGEHVTTSDVSREGTRYHTLQGLYFKLFELLGRRQKT